jgi:hypothetical protein
VSELPRGTVTFLDACDVLILRHANPEFERGREQGRELELDEAVESALAP